ncbi:hypothetical protein ACOMHN_026326 [Nucella lapillus]
MMHNLLKTLTAEQKQRWTEYIAELVQMYNSTPHSSTGFSPFYLMFGREPRLPLDLFLGEQSEGGERMPAEWLKEHLKRLRAAHDKAGEQIRAEAAKRKERHDQGRQVSDLRPNDLVVTKQHYRSRCKIQDFSGERVYVVTQIPGPEGRPYTIRPRDGLDGKKKVTRTEIRRFFPPLKLRPLGTREETAEPGLAESDKMEYLEWHIVGPRGPTRREPNIVVTRGPQSESPAPVSVRAPVAKAALPAPAWNDRGLSKGSIAPPGASATTPLLRRSARSNKGVRDLTPWR